MTDYLWDQDYTSRDDNSPLLFLAKGDTLGIRGNISISSLGSNAPIARLDGNATVTVYNPAQIVATDTAFICGGMNNVIDIRYGGWITGLHQYGIFLPGWHNTVILGQFSIVSSGSMGSGIGGMGAIAGGGYTTFQNSGEVTAVISGTALKLSAGHNDINNLGSIEGAYRAIDINGDNNTLVNKGRIESLSDTAIYIRELEFGTNTISNAGEIVGRLQNSNAYGTAIHTDGLSRDTLDNGTDAKSGYIKGDVLLGEDNDVLTNHHRSQIEGHIDLGTGDDVLINDGSINGSIDLGAGDDSLTNTGDIVGGVVLGDGNDLYRNSGGLSGTIAGGNGIDEIHAGYGDSTIDGGLGSDLLEGGAGRDTFLFSSELGRDNRDTITDFDTTGDSIALDRAVFGALSRSGLPEDDFVLGAAPRDLSDRIGYDPVTGNLWYDPDGKGLSPTVIFAHLETGLALTAAHFLIT
ncbi:calcium-binding protein [Microvirga antarctica]|uniref:calcium-binding protein n=1 Tax=Microvirga antarctica TaxID=2819233 RepID=UPI001B30ECB6|nr:hypothetical protein [Microvirga antarctica]